MIMAYWKCYRNSWNWAWETKLDVNVQTLTLPLYPHFNHHNFLCRFCVNCNKFSMLGLCHFVLTLHISTGTLILTVFASDNDDVNTPNGTFNYRLVSTTPKTDNAEFYINQNDDVGGIYFKGCLNYEVIIVVISVFYCL